MYEHADCISVEAVIYKRSPDQRSVIYTWPCGLCLSFERSDGLPMRLYPEQLFAEHNHQVGPYEF
jgi:hypothetical protein